MVQALKNIGKVIVMACVALALLAVLTVALPNVYMFATEQGNIQEASLLHNDSSYGDEAYDCILVLGASMQPDGTPSTILRDRLDTAVDLYRQGVSQKIIMSGDDSRADSYDEVTNMKRYAVEQGIPSEDIFCDHAGINTYDSMYRARYVFGVKRMVVVTQRYHLYRALFDASSFSIEARGVPSDRHTYEKMPYFEFREVGARLSDMRKVLLRENATHLSEPVSLSQSGDVTSW